MIYNDKHVVDKAKKIIKISFFSVYETTETKLKFRMHLILDLM